MASPPPPPLPPLSPGFRFHPTDEELVGYYLRRKVAGLPIASVDAIAEVDLYKWAPWELPALSRLRSRDRRWFFFSPLDRKYDRSSRTNRATSVGFWKSTGRDRPVVVVNEKKKKIVGMKKSLVFHVGRAPKAKRSDWVMHEYRLEEENDDKKCIGTSFVVCKVFERSAVGNKDGNGGAPLINEELDDVEEEIARDLGSANEETEAADSDDGHAGDSEQAAHSIDQTSIDLMAPGFRFHPTDEELVGYYLKRKLAGLPFRSDVIAEVNLYKWAPWDLPPLSPLSKHNTEWYFFNALDRKYAPGVFSYRANRATDKGYWKTTGLDRSVYNHTTKKIIGMKKTLVFHSGRAPSGKRTDWVMHEYRSEEDEQSSKGSPIVLCRIYHKSGAGPRKAQALYGTPFLEEQEESAQDLAYCSKDISVPNAITDYSLPTAKTEVLEKKCVDTNDFEQVSADMMYNIGNQVEIAYIHEKVPVAWYTATVIKVIDERTLLVEYESLKTEDGTLLSEIVSTQYIRPHVPPTVEVRSFEQLEEVEAFYKGGWWPGVLAKVNSNSKYNVKFMHLEEEIEFNHADLRILYDWVDGQWILASQDKSMEPQNLDIPIPVDHAQILPKSNTAPDNKMPDSDIPSRGCGVEASSNTDGENLKRLIFESSWEGFHPCKKAKREEATENSIKWSDSRNSIMNISKPTIKEEAICCKNALVEKIDVVSVDSVAKSAANTFSGEIDEDPLASDAVLQIYVLAKTGQYGDASQPVFDGQQTKTIVPELDHEGDKGARKYTAENNRNICRTQKLRIIEPHLEGDSMGGNKVVLQFFEEFIVARCGAYSDICFKTNGRKNEMTSCSDDSSVEFSAFSVLSSEAGCEAQKKLLLSTLKKQFAERVTSEKTNDVPPEQAALAFEKSSFWDTIKSMEVFYLMPQQPHFCPLEQYDKDCHEGMAIGLVVTLSSEVNIVRKLEIADCHHRFDGVLKTLVHLERHGFDRQCIQTFLMELLRLKDNNHHLLVLCTENPARKGGAVKCKDCTNREGF